MTKYHSREEKKINDLVSSGKIKPVRIPRLITSAEILKYELCSSIIDYKSKSNLKQSDIAQALQLNKSEVSKIFSYQLQEFSAERLLSLTEDLIKSGVKINLEFIFKEVSKKVKLLKLKRVPEVKSRANAIP